MPRLKLFYGEREAIFAPIKARYAPDSWESVIGDFKARLRRRVRQEFVDRGLSEREIDFDDDLGTGGRRFEATGLTVNPAQVARIVAEVFAEWEAALPDPAADDERPRAGD